VITPDCRRSSRMLVSPGTLFFFLAQNRRRDPRLAFRRGQATHTPPSTGPTRLVRVLASVFRTLELCMWRFPCLCFSLRSARARLRRWRRSRSIPSSCDELPGRVRPVWPCNHQRRYIRCPLCLTLPPSFSFASAHRARRATAPGPKCRARRARLPPFRSWRPRPALNPFSELRRPPLARAVLFGKRSLLSPPHLYRHRMRSAVPVTLSSSAPAVGVRALTELRALH
jgi:hypothetical protein